jgi:hypothetical protein
MSTVQMRSDQQLTLGGVEWKTYLRVLRAFDDRHLRITYDRGALEIMTLSPQIDWTQSSLNRLAIYAVMRLPQVWQYDGQTLRVQLLGADGQYALSQQSQAFPFLPLAELTRFLGMRSTMSETDLLRQFRAWVRGRVAANWVVR